MEASVTHFFSEYAYQPHLIYSGIVLFMILSAFGLPLPEEVVLISAGLVGYTSLHPELYPPPAGHTDVVNVYTLAAVSFAAVLASDYLIFFLGQKFGPKLFEGRFFKRLMRPAYFEKIQKWVQTYGYFACVIFRFTPGIRFPGHLMCGAMGLSTLAYLGIDSVAALLSAPTQVLLAAFYGRHILHYIREFKIALLISALIVFAIIYWRKRIATRESSITYPAATDLEKLG